MYALRMSVINKEATYLLIFIVLLSILRKDMC